MKDLILFPFNGNAQEAIAVIEAINATGKQWNLLGLIDDNPALWGEKFLGYQVLGGQEQLKKYPSAKVLAVPGRSENHLWRTDIIDSLSLSEDRFATLIHPQANISKETKIGFNSLIMAGVVTTVNVEIGNHCVILPNTVLSHHVSVGEGCLVGSNVSASGNVKISPLCYIGSGAKLIQEIQIGEGTLVGIGSVVLSSTDPYTVVAGSPAKLLRRNGS